MSTIDLGEEVIELPDDTYIYKYIDIDTFLTHILKKNSIFLMMLETGKIAMKEYFKLSSKKKSIK